MLPLFPQSGYGCSVALLGIFRKNVFLRHRRSVFMTNRMRKFYSCCVVHYVKYVQKKGTAERVSNPHMDDKTPGSCFGPVKMQLEHVTPCETTACLCCITDVCDSAESRQRTGVSWTWHLDSGSESGCSHRLKMQFCIFAL